MSKLTALGKRGVIESIGNAEDMDIAPAQLIEVAYPAPNFPYLEVDGKDEGFENIKRYIEHYYQDWKLCGYFGDVVQIERIFTESKTIFIISYIGRKAFHKPGLAADLVPFIKDKDGRLFFIGIIRKYSPGKGKFALLGGFTGINGYHLETVAESLVHEGREEAGLLIKPLDRNILIKPFAQEVPVQVSLGKKLDKLKVDTQMILVGTFPTNQEEQMPYLNLKRVYQTTGYTMMVDIGRSLNVEILKGWLTPGDDADKLVFVELNKDKLPEFGIGHHQTVFDEALKIIKNRR